MCGTMQAVQSITKSNAGFNGFQQQQREGTWLARLLGCWHLEMGMPRSQGAEIYRACTSCGARRRFDPSNWQMTGGFYYPGA